MQAALIYESSNDNFSESLVSNITVSTNLALHGSNSSCSEESHISSEDKGLTLLPALKNDEQSLSLATDDC
jgi:hypothetical protein